MFILLLVTVVIVVIIVINIIMVVVVKALHAGELMATLISVVYGSGGVI